MTQPRLRPPTPSAVLATVLAAGLALTAPAAALAAPHHPVRPLRPPARFSATPLTQAECKGLGGRLLDLADASHHCNAAGGGQLCVTVDQNNTVHYACITAK